MKTGNALTALVVLGVVGTAAYQWKTLVQSEMHVAQRNSQHFETLYKDTMDEATEWRDKYDKNAKRLNKADVELTELRRVSEVLKQKGAEDAADGDACTSERTRLESEVRAHLINEAAEKKAREDSSRKVKELEEDLTSARIQRDREKREEEALRADLAQAQEDVSLLEEELARHKRWKQQVELKLKRLGGAGLEIAKHSKGDYNKKSHGGKGHKGHGAGGEDEEDEDEEEGKEKVGGEDDEDAAAGEGHGHGHGHGQGDDSGESGGHGSGGKKAGGKHQTGSKKMGTKVDKEASAAGEGSQDGEDEDKPAPKLKKKSKKTDAVPAEPDDSKR